jgi:hypothetical protein
VTLPDEDRPDLRVWSAVLDRIEQSIRLVDPEGLLDLHAEFEAIGGFEPPAGAGAMPEALLERAQRLLEAVNATAARVAAAQETIGEELAKLQTSPRRLSGNTEAPPPSLVDEDA